MRFCSYVKIRFFFTTLLEHEKALVELRSKIRDHEERDGKKISNDNQPTLGLYLKKVIVMIHFIDTEGALYNEVLHTVKRHHSRPG